MKIFCTKRTDGSAATEGIAAKRHKKIGGRLKLEAPIGARALFAGATDHFCAFLWPSRSSQLEAKWRKSATELKHVVLHLLPLGLSSVLRGSCLGLFQV